SRSQFWFVVGTLTVACAALAGHPQMFTYTVGVGVVYAVVIGWTTHTNTLRYYVAALAMVLIGTALAAIQLVPTAELSHLSVRAALTFPEFVAYELPLRQVPMLFFPYLYGGSPTSFYGTPYFGGWPSSADGWGASELTGYVGLLPLLLAALGFFADRRRSLTWFWFVVALLALLLVLGEATPLGRLTFALPVINKFRAPARYFFIFAFAVSILAGLGVRALQARAVSVRLVAGVIATGALVIVTCVAAFNLLSGKINELALQGLGHAVSVNPTRNLALLIPLLLFVLLSLLLLFWHRRPGVQMFSGLMILALLVDLSSFAWFYEWRYRSPPAAFLRPPAAADTYRTQSGIGNQRILPVRGGLGRVSELPPNLSKLWGFFSVSGYGPLILARTSRMLTMPPHGSVDESWREPANQALDLLAARYVLVPADQVEPPSFTDARGFRWSSANFNYTLGPGCDLKAPAVVNLELPQPRVATSLGMVGALACAVEVPDGVEFAQLTTTDANGATSNYSLKAGRDFSEWAFDCPDVRPAIRHGRATVFSNYPAQRATGQCEGHYYVTVVPLGGKREIASLKLKWTGPPGSVTLRKVSLIDEELHTSSAVNPVAGSLNDNSRWRFIGEINAGNSGYNGSANPEEVGRALVYENLRARPRAWLVPEVLQVTEEQAFTAVRSSQLPDGTAFDPARTAVIEEAVPSGLESRDKAEAGVAGISLLSNDVMELRTSSSAASFLVTSDAYYPGWRATVDNNETHIYRTNYGLRGISLPAGSHLVRFEFRPNSLKSGVGLSAFAMLLFLGASLGLGRWSSLRSSPTVDAEKAQ
ncbi:MAG TPA: YfhO family protein, partial [Pyrinomonadaceae bacterium]|nr:YfhO family protein [Pyrinomonadaceae bacterium]